MTEIDTRPDASAALGAAKGDVRRRPSGEKPPLPRSFTRTDRRVVAGSIAVIALLAALGAANRATSWLDLLDEPFSAAMARLRTPLTVDIAKWVSKLTGPGAFKLYALAILLILVALRRHRRWIVFVVGLLITYMIQSSLVTLVQRPRPFGVEIIGNWAGYSFPSNSVGPSAALLIGGCFCFARSGYRRRLSVILALAVLGVMSWAQLLLGVDHLTDDIAGILLGATAMLFVFKWFVPDSVFPITKGGGNSAHLDLEGPRGAAIEKAMRDQLGLEVDSIRPFGLEGSSGSTPMLIELAGTEPARLFAKLYSTRHVRSDRLYKIGRTLLYGRLEDEASFGSVRRLVEYEDYMMRVMADAGVPVVRTFGVVELTPEREYLLVTEFASGAAEVGDDGVEIDAGYIDEAFAGLRRMWDAGLSHRDIKPANLLIREGHPIFIDVAFGSVRASPWRQAVDLANLMLVLALETNAKDVYKAACRHFEPQDVAEAFAATKSVTMPGELRSRLRHDDRDLIAEFRGMAPGREVIPIQRWSMRRVALWAGVFVGGLALAYLVIVTVLGPDRGAVQSAECPDAPSVVLAGQAVPDSAEIACIRSLPAGWSDQETVVTQKGMVTLLSNDRGGEDALRIEFTSGCDTSTLSSVPVAAGRPPEFTANSDDGTTFTSRTAYTVDGGCLLATLTIPDDAVSLLQPEAREIIGFASRTQLNAELAARSDGRIREI